MRLAVIDVSNGQDAKAKQVVDELLSYRQSAPPNLPTAYAVAAIPVRYALERRDWKAAADFLYGNGLRRGFANTEKGHPYETVNASLQRVFTVPKVGIVKVRFDVVNLFDKIYELRDGSGIGVGAPQFGQRRGFYGTVAYDF